MTRQSHPPISSDNDSSTGDQLHTPSSSLSPVAQSHPVSRNPSPLSISSLPQKYKKKSHLDKQIQGSQDQYEKDDLSEDSDAYEMSSVVDHAASGQSHQPLLQDDKHNQRKHGSDERPVLSSRRSHLRARSPTYVQPQDQTRRKYILAAICLLISLVSFVVQTETAVYIQHELHWNKAYCMLWLTHGSWSLLYPIQLVILRATDRKQSWSAFWRRHKALVNTTAQMVKHQTLYLSSSTNSTSPWPSLLKTTAFITSFLTFAGGSWYVAVNLTSPSDLTAIYNCSAFFAYVFSILLLKEKARLDKIFSVALAIAGVLVVAYGDSESPHPKTPGHSGGATNPNPDPDTPPDNRLLGNLLIGIGSILYGLYEVLYKRYACPPEGTNPTRGMIFANTFGSLVGLFTLTVLWIPLPILHFTGLEVFELPTGKAAALLTVSTLSNAIFSGAFLVLMSLTSPVLSSVAALLTIFLVAITDYFLTGKPLSPAAVGGGTLIIIAFVMLSWATYREMKEEERKREVNEDKVIDDDDEEEEEEDGNGVGVGVGLERGRRRGSSIVVRDDVEVEDESGDDDAVVGGKGERRGS